MAGSKNIEKKNLNQELHQHSGGALAAYKGKVLGEGSGLLHLIRYELTTLFFANLGGGIGYLLRKKLTAGLFKACGSGAILGRGLVLRKPKHIELGLKVSIDDYVMLDGCFGRGTAIAIGDEVIISKGCVVQAKTGTLAIGDKCDIGAHTIITAVNSIVLEPSVLIAGNCYIGGARYHLKDRNRAIMEQGIYSRGPISIGEGTWIGASATILDGVSIGRGCVVGAGALVINDIPDYAVAVGAPAKILKIRE